MTRRIYINDGWSFTGNCTDEFLNGGECPDISSVRLPHTCAVTPYNYFEADIYQMVCAYRRIIDVPKEWESKRIFLTVEGAAHKAEVFLGGKKLSEHECGYTTFKTELTGHLRPGKNILAIKVDSRETLDQPPFGKVIDYMTYGGLYREVFLEAADKDFIEDVFAMPEILKLPDEKKDKPAGACARLKSEISLCVSDEASFYIRQRVYPLRYQTSRPAPAADSDMAAVFVCEKNEDGAYILELDVPEVLLWDTDSPELYILSTELYENVSAESIDINSTDIICGWDADEKKTGAKGRLFRLMDRKEVRIGFRKSEFKADGYYLNGRKVKLLGLNRHQSFPYAGYAMPASLQRLDADILKNELGVNAVRTSHYPCSGYFYDRCDELGLLVFTEIPGWQSIGGEHWKDQALENTKDMVHQLRNHASVILWGVRINESADCDELYLKTNAAAKRLDPSRPTGGVRYIKNSHLLEDVYTYNDFSFSGKSLKEGAENRAQAGKDTWHGCEPRGNVTKEGKKAYLISEYNGHMFPTKTFDCEDHRCEHALRHAAVLDSVAAQEDIAGSFGWCMFDYNTHREFGSGDHICHHGVMDMFRNPKPAAAVYAAQQSREPVLEITSSMDIGEHPQGLPGRVYIITNADEVRFYKNDVFIKAYTHADSAFKNMKNGPIEITDYIGDAFKKEGLPEDMAKGIKELLNRYARFGTDGFSLREKARAAKLMLKYKMNMEQAYNLYGKYIGGWGDKNTVYKFEAVKDGKVVKTVLKEPAGAVFIKAAADHTLLKESSSYDAAAVRITAADQNGNVLPYYFESISLETEGPIELIGPSCAQLKGGFGGTYVKTTGESGRAALILKSAQAEDVKIEFEVEKAGPALL